MSHDAMPPQLQVLRLPHAKDLPLPAYQSAAAAGFDLLAAIDAPLALAPGDRATVPTGLTIALPVGTEGQVRPRSGLAARHGVTVLNSPGTIDADYRGEICVILVNLGHSIFIVSRGMRVAQLVVAPVLQVAIWENDILDETTRGVEGFGSTGVGPA